MYERPMARTTIKYESVSLVHQAGCFGYHSMVMRKALVFFWER
jgi:hypothetical protein